MQLVSPTLILWIVIYPVDSAIRRLNNRGMKDTFACFKDEPLCGYGYLPTVFVAFSFPSDSRGLFTKSSHIKNFLRDQSLLPSLSNHDDDGNESK